MYETTAYCVDPDCCCDHRNGLVLYRGPSLAGAEAARDESVHAHYAGYEVEVIKKLRLV